MDHSLVKFGSEEEREGSSRGKVEIQGLFLKFRRNLDVFKS